MSEYQKPYLILWGAITDALKKLEDQNYGLARETLLNGQKEAEEAYINWPEDEKTLP